MKVEGLTRYVIAPTKNETANRARVLGALEARLFLAGADRGAVSIEDDGPIWTIWAPLDLPPLVGIVRHVRLLIADGRVDEAKVKALERMNPTPFGAGSDGTPGPSSGIEHGEKVSRTEGNAI